MGFVYSTAILEGWSPPPDAVSFMTQDAEAVMVPRRMSMSLEKTFLDMSTAEGLNGNYSDAGDTVVFQVTINNTGSTILSAVALSDGAAGAEAPQCDQDFTAPDSKFFPSSHPSGAPLVCNVTVPVTAFYVDAGGFNTSSEVGIPLCSGAPDPCRCTALGDFAAA